MARLVHVTIRATYTEEAWQDVGEGEALNLRHLADGPQEVVAEKVLRAATCCICKGPCGPGAERCFATCGTECEEVFQFQAAG